MKTSTITKADIESSVLSVPPLARRADYSIDKDGNAKILAHLRAGGVKTFMYGGNANLYNMAPSEFVTLCELLIDLSSDDDWMIPSVGSDFGKAQDQLTYLKTMPFPTAMVLPHRFPATPAGVATGIRRLADTYGKPVIAYVKDDGYIDAAHLGKLDDDGAICAVKYAIVRDDPKEDAFLDDMLSVVDKDIVISGIGERPAIDHLTKFELGAFTSGSVCVGPASSTALLKAVRRGDLKEAARLRELFMPLEDLRDGISPLRVLHAAVHLAGIAETGPLLPYLSNVTDARQLADIERAAKALLAADKQTLAKAA
ncbi:MAG TPA: dihydrodipicolinate synthase family protein [Pseudorhodoplanes sp.]|nr:dihydrodipicolinate synthase family protein [Pseudorhodoplanes sp.]